MIPSALPKIRHPASERGRFWHALMRDAVTKPRQPVTIAGMSSKPQYRVGAAGLDPRDWRLIEIVFKHSQYNKFEYALVAQAGPDSVDILIANTMAPEGVAAVVKVRQANRVIPVISAVPRGAPSSARHAISIDRLTLQLLPILNRVVEIELLGERSLARAVSPPIAHRPETRASNLVQFPGPASPARTVGDPGVVSRLPAVPPAVVPPAAQPLFPAPDVSSSGLADTALKVLIVDDSPTVRKQLGLAFERMGLAVFSAADAQRALEILEDQHVDLAMVDVVMPEMDGYKLTRELKRRAKAQGKFLPVIILTSRSSPFDLARGALCGCDSYLAKPVPPRALELAVHKQLRRALAIDDLGAYLKPLLPGHSSPPAPGPQAAQATEARAAPGSDPSAAQAPSAVNWLARVRGPR
jgi:CheY-like chemotaxis protein